MTVVSNVEVFRRIAIINRGEPAVRFLRALREYNLERGLHITAVVFYTDCDRRAPFVRQADVAVPIGPAMRQNLSGATVSAYLDHEHILALLVRHGCDAVWPGWGFIAEDAQFVAKLEAAKIAFIGPSSDAMHRLGDKIEAKRLAQSSGVPLAPWCEALPEWSDEELLDQASKVGYPLMVKASAGGGGRGIRKVKAPGELVEKMQAVRAEVKSIFGAGGVLLEACVTRARHIEVQLVVNAQGQAFAMGVRDCSIQRKNQKVIEEAPSPVLPPKIEHLLCNSARKLAESAGYKGVGTAEFLYQPATQVCTFLEVNSRLQVEHTITEMVLRCDLVKAQLDIAHGIPWHPTNTVPLGHAIELRVNAENPEEDFRPSPGVLLRFRPPSGPGVRVDSGVAEGLEIPPYFDSMIAKIIAWGPTREQATARALRACRELDAVVEDGATNKALLCSLLQHPAFVNAEADTTWLDGAVSSGTLGGVAHTAEALIAGAILESLERHKVERERFFAEAQDGIPQRIPEPTGLPVDLKLRAVSYQLVVVALDEERYLVGPAGRLCSVTFQILSPGVAELWIQGRWHKILFARGAHGVAVEVDGHMHAVERSSGGVVRAPAPAVVVHVAVEESDHVAVGDVLCTLEAMKMEMAVYAQEAGRVASVHCLPNQQVPTGQPLFLVESFDDEASGQVADNSKLFPETEVDALERLFVDGVPTPQQLDAFDEATAKEVVDALVGLLRPVMLGFDIDHDVLQRAQSLLDATQEFSGAKHPERWLPLFDVLGMFADTAMVLDRNLLLPHEGGATTPADIAFYSFCRRNKEGEEGVLPEMRSILSRALLRYDVKSFDSTPRLREALWRMALAHTHDAARHHIISSLLRVVIQLHAAGLSMEQNELLKDVVKRIAQTARSAYPFVRDNAMQALYVLFERPKIAIHQGAIDSFVEDALRRIQGLAPDHKTTREVLDTLGRHHHTLQSTLLAHVHKHEHELDCRVLEALVRRFYAPAEYIWTGDIKHERAALVLGQVSRTHSHKAQKQKRVFAMFVAREDLAAVFEEVTRKHNQGLFEIVLHKPVEDEAALVLELDACFVDSHTLQHDSRVALSWYDVTQRERHRTYIVHNGMLQEQSLIRQMHPEAAHRVALDRLNLFELERLSAQERVYAFHGRARANPKDERIFICAEIFASASQSKEELLMTYEHTFLDALRTLREVQQGRSRRTRLRWNWLMITMHTPIHMTKEDIFALAYKLEPYTHGLSVRELHVRVPLLGGDDASSSRPTELIFRKVGRHRMDVEEREPSNEDVAVMSPYDLRVVRARRRGFVPPYEIIRMLEGGPTTARGMVPHPDLTEGRFQEYDLNEDRQLVPVARPFGGNTCGVVVGVMTNATLKHPEGLKRVWIGSEPTMAMGALSEPECRRIIASLELAEQLQVPVEWIPISSGAKISMDSGTENLDWTAHALRHIVNFTQKGGQINVIVHGINVGAQSYWNAEATMLMHCTGALIMTLDGAMVLTGKKALDFSGGVSAEDERGIGGAERIMGPNGQAQFVARDLGEAYRILFDWYRFTYQAPGETSPRPWNTNDPDSRSVLHYPYNSTREEFETIGQIFDATLNAGRKKPFAVRQVMQAVMDQDGGYLERFAHLIDGESSVVWEAHIGGIAVTLLGVESRPTTRQGRVPMDGPDTWSGGTLFPQSSRKVARAINSASGLRPVVVLANLSGFDGSPESMRRLQLEYGAEIGRAVVNFLGPIIFVVIGRYHGGAYVVFSKALNPNLRALAVEGSFASVIGGAPAAAVVFPRDVDARTLQDERVQEIAALLKDASEDERPALRERFEDVRAQVMLEKRGEVAAEFDTVHSVQRAVAVGSLDAVIEPKDLRPAIIAELKRARSAKEV